MNNNKYGEYIYSTVITRPYPIERISIIENSK